MSLTMIGVALLMTSRLCAPADFSTDIGHLWPPCSRQYCTPTTSIIIRFIISISLLLLEYCYYYYLPTTYLPTYLLPTYYLPTTIVLLLLLLLQVQGIYLELLEEVPW